MRNKMKFWRKMAVSIKRAIMAKGMHETGNRYGRHARVPTLPPQWRGGPPPFKAPSPLLSGLLKQQSWWPEQG